MRMQRRGMALLGATTVASLWAFAVACSDQSPWPTTVLSGNPGGGVGGGSEGEADATSPSDDTGTGDDAAEGDTGSGFAALFSCETFASGTGYCTTYKTVPQSVAAQLENSCSSATTNVLLSNAVCPQGSSTATEGVTVGCCTSTSSGYTIEQCFYGSNTNSLTTSTGCTATGGTLSTQPM